MNRNSICGDGEWTKSDLPTRLINFSFGIRIELVFKPCLGAVQDAEATDLRIPATGKKAKKEYVIDELQKFTEYRLWMKAGTSVGDGPRSYPVLTKTDEDGKKCTALFHHFPLY